MHQRNLGAPIALDSLCPIKGKGSKVHRKVAGIGKERVHLPIPCRANGRRIFRHLVVKVADGQGTARSMLAIRSRVWRKMVSMQAKVRL